MDEPNSNPYAAPATSPDDTPVPATDSRPWVVRKDDIICYGNTVNLPPICIVAGDMTDLLPRSATITVPRWWMAAAALATFVAGILSVEWLGARPGGALILVGAALLVFVGTGRQLGRTRFRSLFHYIDVTWYVSKDHVKSSRVITVCCRGLAAAVAFGAGFLVLIQESLFISIPACLFFGAAAFGLMTWSGALNAESALQFRGRAMVGRHTGRILLKGHTRLFYQQLNDRLRGSAWEDEPPQ